ncbi:hypothetical protein ACKVMT_17465 [Halobacteriales archaeon Cl-PHB]
MATTESPTHDRTESATDQRDDTDTREVLYETTPTTRVVVIQLVATLVLGALVSGLFLANARALGPGLTDIALWIVLGITVIVGLRLGYKMLLLNRTTYKVREDAVQREFNLFFRYLSRELPYEHVWGHELSQRRVQSLLGIGDVAFLTGGNHQGLGFVKFEHVREPQEMRSWIQQALQEHDQDEI